MDSKNSKPKQRFVHSCDTPMCGLDVAKGAWIEGSLDGFAYFHEGDPYLTLTFMKVTLTLRLLS